MTLLPSRSYAGSVAITAQQPIGEGTEASPYLIATEGNLLWMSENFASPENCSQYYSFNNQYFVQTKNLDISSIANWTPIGTDAKMFSGIYDGAGHTVSGLNYTGNAACIGLFGYIYGTVKNLGVINVNILSAGENAGGLAGKNRGPISNCYTTGRVEYNGAGNRCYLVGGLIGTSTGDIYNCYSTCDVSSSATVGSVGVGGLVGNGGSQGVTITNCFAVGTVSGGTWLGELIGATYSNIKYCYGKSEQANIKVVGCENRPNLVENSTLKDDAFFKTLDNYTQSANYSSEHPWDFTDTWTIDAAKNNGYPSLIPHSSGSTVTYNRGEHGYLIGLATEKVAMDGKPSSIPPVQSFPGYAFVYWSSDAGTTKLTQAELRNQIITEDITYTAYYTQILNSKDSKVTVNGQGITYPTYEINGKDYTKAETIKAALSMDASLTGYSYEIYQSDGSTPATDMDISNRLIVTKDGGEFIAAEYTLMTEVKYGDVNGDGLVNMVDLALMQRHILDATAYPLKQKSFSDRAADMNNDYKVDASDVLLLKQHLINADKHKVSPEYFNYGGAA
jgi:hypothetical protein